MTAAKPVDLGLRFLLELGALCALGYWGWHAGTGASTRFALAVGAPLLAAVVWGTLVSPKAPVSLPEPVRLLVELTVFGAAVAGLAVTGRPLVAAGFGVVVVANELRLTRWDGR